jgi:hypothetical protein
MATPQQRVLTALLAGDRDWAYLKATAELNDGQLGLTLSALLSARLIWTAQHNETRLYGLGKQKGGVR